jgi:hypothetical protein
MDLSLSAGTESIIEHLSLPGPGVHPERRPLDHLARGHAVEGVGDSEGEGAR